MASKTLEESQNKKVNPKNPFEFENFASQGSIRGLNYGPFRENVRLFLQEYSKIQDFAVSCMRAWFTLLTSEENEVSFPLYTIEETVENSPNPFCDNCKFTGWGHHFVSQRKYHFIIPALARWKEPLEADIFELRTHILYGLVHCNGFGHLICINGLKWESSFLSNTRVMNFWDRLCSTLCTRKISVRDENNLRLLYAVVNGQSWYRRWGYEFSRGSFGVTKGQYERAILYLKSLRLEKIVTDFERKKIRQIVDKHRESRCAPLITLSDLLRFIMGRKQPINADELATLLAKRRSKYSADDITLVLNQIMIVLNKTQASDGGKACICRKELHDEIRKCVRDKALIGFVLKSITRFAIGNCVIIRRLKNTSAKEFEFMIDCEETNMLHDEALYLCKNLLLRYKDLDALRNLLDSKNFVKEWRHHEEQNSNQFMAIKWKVLPSFDEIETELNRPLSPAEIALVSPSMTIAELKDDAQTALRDTYCIMNSFTVSQIGAFKKIDPDKMVSGTIDPDEPVWVRGSGHDFGTKLRYEDGHQRLNVECICGTKYDDGERFVACNECKVYQHTRCRGFDDHKAAPLDFLCSKCDAVFVKK